MRIFKVALAILVAAAMGFVVLSSALAERGGTKGPKFQLFGTATDSVDPENATNEVLKINNTSDFGGASRDLHKNTQAEEIDNQVQLKYFIAGTKTCILGSPRIQLAIDRDGDGNRDGNAFGYLGDKPFGGLCPPNAWTLEDMTNAQQKWDLSQLGGGMTLSWDQMEVFLRTASPNYQILRGTLVEDPGVGPGSSGITYFDNIVIGNRTINDHSDTAGH